MKMSVKIFWRLTRSICLLKISLKTVGFNFYIKNYKHTEYGEI